jgi:hypothetical protein
MKLRVATFDADHCVTDSTKSIVASFQKLLDSTVKSLIAELTVGGVDVSGESIGLSINLLLPLDFLHVLYIQDKQMVAFNFIFDLLWTDGGSLVSSVAFLKFRGLK